MFLWQPSLRWLWFKIVHALILIKHSASMNAVGTKSSVYLLKTFFLCIHVSVPQNWTCLLWYHFNICWYIELLYIWRMYGEVQESYKYSWDIVSCLWRGWEREAGQGGLLIFEVFPEI